MTISIGLRHNVGNIVQTLASTLTVTLAPSRPLRNTDEVFS